MQIAILRCDRFAVPAIAALAVHTRVTRPASAT